MDCQIKGWWHHFSKDLLARVCSLAVGPPSQGLGLLARHGWMSGDGGTAILDGLAVECRALIALIDDRQHSRKQGPLLFNVQRSTSTPPLCKTLVYPC
jgi:hypothetical protein